jgi:hypothetical protein
MDSITCSYQNLQTPISKAGCSLFRLSAAIAVEISNDRRKEESCPPEAADLSDSIG